MSRKDKDNDLKKSQPIENLISNTIKEIKSMVDSDIVELNLKLLTEMCQ